MVKQTVNSNVAIFLGLFTHMKLLPLLSLIANVNATVAQLWKIEAQNPNLWSSFFGAIQNLYFVPRSCQDMAWHDNPIRKLDERAKNVQIEKQGRETCSNLKP